MLSCWEGSKKMKKRTGLLVFIIAILLSVSFLTVAFACSGYGSRNHWANSGKVYCKITACSCTPRANFQYASPRARYEGSDGNLYWTGWNWDHGYDVSSKSAQTVPPGDVTEGTVHYRHSCSTGGSAYDYYDIPVAP